MQNSRKPFSIQEYQSSIEDRAAERARAIKVLSTVPRSNRAPKKKNLLQKIFGRAK